MDAADAAVAFAIGGPIARTDFDGLCDRLCELLSATDAVVLVCEVDGVEPDAVTVDALARLALTACRRGRSVRLRGASPQLRALVAFMGLTDVLADRPLSDRDAAAARTAGTGARSPGRT